MTDDGLIDAGAGRYCADCSREAGEQVFGTAPQVDVWLVLEYNGTWGAKAVKDSRLPAEVLAHLSAPVEGLAVRLLLVRQAGRQGRGIAFFVAVADELDPRLYEFSLTAYADLLAIDIARVVRGDADYAVNFTTGLLYLICTNGRRDRSCARYGVPLYAAMHDAAGDAVWQSTHLGGHRFAATALVLPHGVLYGHLDVEEGAELVQRHSAALLLPHKVRGRTCYSGTVQAAESYLRAQTGEYGLMAFRLLDIAGQGEDRWRVQFEERATGTVHTLDLRHGPSAVEVYLSSTDETTSPVVQYELLSYAASHAVQDESS